jgi:hypothetical protein
MTEALNTPVQSELPAAFSPRRTKRVPDRLRFIEIIRSSSLPEDDTSSLHAGHDTYEYSSENRTLLKGSLGRDNSALAACGRGAATDSERLDDTVRIANRDGSKTKLSISSSILDEQTSQQTPSSWQARNRIPGGAAAKLMIVGPKKTDDSDDTGLKTTDSHPDTLSVGSLGPVDDKLKEIELQMQQAKEEFERGSTENRRYNQRDDENFTDREENKPARIDCSTTPKFLNRGESFHETAAAAVLALLSTRTHQSVFGSYDELVFTYSTNKKPLSPRSNAVIDSASYESPEKRDIAQFVLSEHTEKKLQSLRTQMRNPNKTMTDLLTKIASPDDGEMNLGYMVRRKNACGALHTLTATKKNQQPICWTLGVLTALTSVLVDGRGGSETQLKRTFPDDRIREEYKQARNRAIAALMNLCMPKENRIAITHTPELVQTAISIILEDDDDGIARRGCCAILAYLGKSSENRLLLAQVPGLLDALMKVLAPRGENQSTVVIPECKSSTSNLKMTSLSAQSTLSSSSADSGESTISAESSYRSSFSRGTDELDSPPASPRPEEYLYDDGVDDLLKAARQNAFALILHLIKEKDNSYHFARNDEFVRTMVEISKFQESPSHVMAVKVLANLTRHRLNTNVLVFERRVVVSALVRALGSPHPHTREYGCYALQNIAQDKSCRQELATTPNLIESLCQCTRQSSGEAERLAATSALKNMCDEPANLIPMSNTPDGISSLMLLTHDEGVSDVIQYRACDAISTLSYWLRKIATSGKALDANLQGTTPPDDLFVPTLRVVTWNQWQ